MKLNISVKLDVTLTRTEYWQKVYYFTLNRCGCPTVQQTSYTAEMNIYIVNSDGS